MEGPQSHTAIISQTLAPAYGPAPGDAVVVLVERYQELNRRDQLAFVVALVSELVARNARRRVLEGGAE